MSNMLETSFTSKRDRELEELHANVKQLELEGLVGDTKEDPLNGLTIRIGIQGG